MPAFAQFPYQGSHLSHARRVQSIGGLVQEQHFRVSQQRIRDAQPLLHAHGIGVELAVGPLGEAHHLQKSVQLLAGPITADALEIAKVVAPAKVGVEARLLHNRPNAPESGGADPLVSLERVGQTVAP